MMEIPVTISAFSSGMLFSPMNTLRFLSVMAFMATHAITPITVAMMLAQRAMVRVFPRASISSSLANISLYHLRLKPCQDAMDFDELKLSTMRVPMGR